jgi:hypothetical protein
METRRHRGEPERTSNESLTCIRDAYTLATTSEGSELDDIMLQHFIETLAEVALSVASRRNGIAGGFSND